MFYFQRFSQIVFLSTEITTPLVCESAEHIESRDLSRFFSTHEDLALISQRKDQGIVEPADDFPVLEAAAHSFRPRLFGSARALHESQLTQKVEYRIRKHCCLITDFT